VLINLLINARDAIPREGGCVQITTGRPEDEPGQFISVSDDGTGIDRDILPRIFEPFVTNKPPDEGTGLGLAIAAEIMEGHGGRLEGRNNEDGGATFIMFLPESPAEE